MALYSFVLRKGLFKCMSRLPSLDSYFCLNLVGLRSSETQCTSQMEL